MKIRRGKNRQICNVFTFSRRCIGDARLVKTQLTRGSCEGRVLWVNTIPAKVGERARARTPNNLTSLVQSPAKLLTIERDDAITDASALRDR